MPTFFLLLLLGTGQCLQFTNEHGDTLIMKNLNVLFAPLPRVDTVQVDGNITSPSISALQAELEVLREENGLLQQRLTALEKSTTRLWYEGNCVAGGQHGEVLMCSGSQAVTAHHQACAKTAEAFNIYADSHSLPRITGVEFRRNPNDCLYLLNDKRVASGPSDAMLAALNQEFQSSCTRQSDGNADVTGPYHGSGAGGNVRQGVCYSVE